MPRQSAVEELSFNRVHWARPWVGGLLVQSIKKADEKKNLL